MGFGVWVYKLKVRVYDLELRVDMQGLNVALERLLEDDL